MDLPVPFQSDNFQLSSNPDKVISIVNEKLGDDYVTVQLTVKNTLDKTVLYKLKVTSNYLFRLLQPSGFIESGGSKQLMVKMRPKFGIPTDSENHHLTFYYMVKPDNLEIPVDTHFSVRSIWRELEEQGKAIEYRMFRMIFKKMKPVNDPFFELPQKESDL